MDKDGIVKTDVSSADYPEKITEKDLRKSWFRWWYANEIPHTYDRMIAPSFLWAITPILRKLYKK